MRVIRFILSLSATILLLWSLQHSFQVGGKPLPPIGNFFNPFSGFWKNAEPLSGPHIQNISLPGLTGKVQVVYDDLLVPHIFATNLEDAYRVQGYITAQYRLFQMDMTTRRAAGRLSEIIGERTLKIDQHSRRIGLGYAAERDLQGWEKSDKTLSILNAYTAGVNAWISQLAPNDYPIEYKLLNFAPEPWTNLKTALVSEAMAETLCSRSDDLESSNAFAAFGKPTFDYLYPEWNPKQQPIVPDTGQWKSWHPFTPPAAPEAMNPGESIGFSEKKNTSPSYPPLEEYMVGSNNWAVNAVKSRNGEPLLANDPHLSLTLPSIWYEVQVNTPFGNTYGVSLPGIPGVIIGFNDNIAWGVTNVSHDVTDYYKIHWTDASRSKYKLDAEVRSVDYRVESIGVKGKGIIQDTVRYTVFGPMPFDNDPGNPLFDYSLRWVAHDVPERSTLDIFLALNTAKSYDDYKAALAGYDAPAQNFVFASRTGDIAIQVEGKFPVRGKEQGRFLQDGGSWANAWHAFIPWDEVPALKNPSRGFVFSANQHSTPPSYPYYYLGNFEDFRSRRIYDRLSQMQSATPDSMRSVQLDNFSQRAADCLPAMLHLLDRKALNQEENQLADLLATWNFKYDADQMAPVYYEAWSDSCYALTWDEMAAIQQSGKPVLFPEIWRWIDLMQTDTANIFFDIRETANRETASDIVLESFKQMEGYFKAHPEKKQNWGTAHPTTIRHLAQIDAFSRTVITGGNKSAPNAINSNHGPSWRMIVDMGQQVSAQGVYPGGQSGNPGSKYYDNMVDTWANGKYYPLCFMHAPDETFDRLLIKQTISPK